MLKNIIKLSLNSIWNKKMRSFLTMLGIIIGVMAVVILVSITQNASEGITDSISEMGSTQITVSINEEDSELTEETLMSLLDNNTIEAIAPVITTNKTVTHNENSSSFSIVGVTTSYFNVQGINIQRGRLFVESDIEYKTNIAIIGTEVATELFGTWDAIGGTISFGERNYKVVGVLEEQGSSLVGSEDSKILIPYSTAERITGQSEINNFYIKTVNSEVVNRTINIVENFLLQIFRDEDAYSVSNQSDILDTMEDVNNTMSILLAGIAAISLLVGGIGIMNIMLVSVTERTKEIGIRKAVGAKRKHIMLQFLTESCVLSILGGIIGLVLSIGAIEIYNIFVSSKTSINWEIGFGSVIFCAVIGIIFGSYPAAKASKLQPIDALHI